MQRCWTCLLALIVCLVGGEGCANRQALMGKPENGGTRETLQSDQRTVATLFANLEAKWPANHTVNIVFHGHSVPAGYHRTPEVRPFESYPFLVWQGLKQRFPNAVINPIVTAIGGENSAAGAKRFERDVLSHRPELIFIDYALNDRGLPEAEAEQAWRRMIESALRNQIAVVLITPTGAENANLKNPAEPLNQRADLIRRLGKEYGVPVADVLRRWTEALDRGRSQKELLSQINHPNLEGHRLAAAEILRTLDSMRLGAAPRPLRHDEFWAARSQISRRVSLRGQGARRVSRVCSLCGQRQ